MQPLNLQSLDELSLRLTAGNSLWDNIKKVSMAGLNMQAPERDPEFVNNVLKVSLNDDGCCSCSAAPQSGSACLACSSQITILGPHVLCQNRLLLLHVHASEVTCWYAERTQLKLHAGQHAPYATHR